MSVPGGADTTDLRTGAPIHDDLLALLPLVGEWAGTGTLVVPSTGREHRFGQRVTFAHDGRPFLSYSARAWLLAEDGSVIRNAMRETGFWRPGPGQDDIEAQVALITGLVITYTGVAGDLRWELASTTVTSTPSALELRGERRLYAVLDEQLVYVTELAVPTETGVENGVQYAPHLNASLARI